MNNNRWDENIFLSTQWLYDQHIVSGGNAFIHIPLIYLTKLPVLQEIYANAIAEFPSLIGLTNILNPIVIDNAVVMFPVQNFETFRYKCFETFMNDSQIKKKFIRQTLFLKKWLPILCLKAENQFLSTNTVSHALINRLYKMTVRAISLNLSNPFLEILFIKTNKLYSEDQTYKQKVDAILWPKIFSHMAYYNCEYNHLKHLQNNKQLQNSDIFNFCWHTAFLQNPVGDGSKLENPENLADEIDVKINDDFNTYLLKNNRLPEIQFDPSGIIDNYYDSNDTQEEILYLLRCLQVNEEVRHYWSLRFTRLLRLIAKTEEHKQNWNLSDYEKHCKK